MTHVIKLVKTCEASPEQYDAVSPDGTRVGYLRLRWGYFSVTCPGIGGEQVYDSYTNGDGLFDDDEREHELAQATRAIMDWVERQDNKVAK